MFAKNIGYYDLCTEYIPVWQVPGSYGVFMAFLIMFSQGLGQLFSWEIKCVFSDSVTLFLYSTLGMQVLTSQHS